MRLRVGALGVFALCWLGRPEPSRAGITDALYEDVKTVIGELLTDEVAQSIAPNVVCYAGRQQVTATPKLPYDVVTFGAGTYRFDALTYFPQTLHRIYSRQFGALQATAQNEVAEFAGYQLYQALSGNPLEILGTATQTTYEAPKDVKGKSCQDAVRDRFATGDLAVPEASPLAKVCKDAVLQDRFKCELSFGLADALRGDTAGLDERLMKAISSVVTQNLTKLGADAGKATEVYERTVLVVRELMTGSAPVGDQIKAYVVALLELAGRPTGQADIDALSQQITDVLSALKRARSQWRTVARSDATSVSVSSFIETIASNTGALQSLCAATGSSCPDFTKLAAQAELVASTLRAVGQKNIADVANIAMRAIFARSEETDCSSKLYPGVKCNRDAFRSFLSSFVQYVLEASKDGSPSEVTRAALRSAAIDAIRAISYGGGIDRRGWRLACGVIPLPGRGFFLPELGLRVSWSPSYINRNDRSVRYIATANMLTFKPILRYTDTTYAAVHFSLLDPLAPLAELAARETEGVTYSADTEDRIWWNVISPRLEFIVGVPAFSKHLVIGAGASLRLVAPHVEASAPTEVDYEYLGDGDLFDHFEFGFALKYVM